MKSTSHGVILFLILLSGLAVGWFVPGFWAITTSIPTPSNTSQTTPRPPAPPNNRSGISPVSDQTLLDWQSGLETAADCSRLVESLRDTPRPDHPLFASALRDYALRRWLELDPEDALSFAEKAGGQGVAEAILPELLKIDPAPIDRAPKGVTANLAKSWTDRNPEEAIAFAHGRPADDSLRRELLAHAARSLSTADPERALQLYLDSAGGSSHAWENPAILREAFASLAGQDREQATSKVLEFSGKDREAAMSGVLTNAFSDDLASAISLTRAWLADPTLKDSVIPAVKSPFPGATAEATMI